MNLFDKLVTEALKNRPEFSQLRIVVEKELLHHDILRVLSENNLLTDLTFIGGTCLRYCYGGIRLSEDLDFTGGHNFNRDTLSSLAKILIHNLQEKYGLSVHISEPTKDKHNVDTWKIKIETRPQENSVPAQRINIDICSVSSYEKKPMMLINPYGVDMGTSGLILQAESSEEIYVDKLLAFAYRPNRIKYRDLWDIAWLHGKGIQPKLELLPLKLQERNYTMDAFLLAFSERKKQLQDLPALAAEFAKEMGRFLPQKAVNQPHLWSFITNLIDELYTQITKKR